MSTGSSDTDRARSSRRAALRAAAGAGISLLAGGGIAETVAQIPEGTPAATGQDVNTRDASARAGPRNVEGREPPSGRPVRGGTLRIARPGERVENFNPAAFAQDQQIQLSYLEPLVRPDPFTLRPTPWLAQGWAWRADGLALDLMIRDDVTWHDGTALTAADAKFSYEVYQDDADSAVAGFFSLVEAVEAESDDRLQVRFRERDANWLFNAATLPIFSRQQYGDFWSSLPATGRTLSDFDWSQSLPVGTGAWQIADWDATHVNFIGFNRTWREAPWYEELTVTVEAGIRQRFSSWMARDSDIAWPVRARDVRETRDVNGILHVVEAASVMFAAFNFSNPLQPSGSLWADLRVRRAASMAINRERYADEVFGGFMRWDAVGTVTQPWAHDSTLFGESYSPEAAAILLAEAGWVDYDGDGILEDVNGWPLRPIAIVRADSRPELAEVLARVARDLSVVGIGLTIDTLSPQAFAERWISSRTYDLIAYAYDQLPGFTDFDLYGSRWDVRTNPTGWNPGGYANADADAAIEDFLSAISIKRQAAALQRLQRSVTDDLFGLWLGFPRDLVLVAEGINGFEPDMAWQTARTWDLWQSATRS